MPDVLFTTQGGIGFINDIQRFPKRGELMMKESGFDFSSFRTPEELGYTLAARVVPTLPPWWFPTSWTPWAGERLINQRTLLVSHPAPRRGRLCQPGLSRVFPLAPRRPEYASQRWP